LETPYVTSDQFSRVISRNQEIVNRFLLALLLEQLRSSVKKAECEGKVAFAFRDEAESSG
jgi:hypothetical protein